MKKSAYETVILNAPDPALFNRSGKREPDQDKIRLVATSWSENMKKGFDVYQSLDENLDLERFDMRFIGNSPVKFKNIRWIKPVPSHDVASILKAHDIFVTASKDDPCSNSLIEALHCGLPAAARNDGGHPEIIGEAGEFFEDQTDVIDAIEKIAANYQHYQSKINVPSIEDVGQSYYQFAQSIHQNCLTESSKSKSTKQKKERIGTVLEGAHFKCLQIGCKTEVFPLENITENTFTFI